MGTLLRNAIVLMGLVLLVPACSSGGGGGGGGGTGDAVAPPPSSNQAPGVSLVRPSPGSAFTAGTPIDLEAAVTDADGFVTRVDFFQGSILLGSSPAFPFRFTWTGAAPGTFSLLAVGVDNAGASVASDPVSVTVTAVGGGGGTTNRPPTVTMSSPTDGATFPEGYPVIVSADAADSEGPVVRVDFFDGAAPLGSATAAPFQIQWTAAPAGSRSLRAVATDTGGATASSPPVAVTVTPPASTGVLPQGSLQGVFFVNGSRGWVVGAGGGIWTTADGGVTWTAQSSGTTAQLNRLQFVSATLGWIVGESGTILKTTDGGATWTASTSGTSGSLRGLSFVDASTGWVVGSDPLPLKTTNGGVTWTPQNAGTSGGLSAVSFVNASTGWVSGDGAIYKTSDGGATWTSQTTEFFSFTGIDHLAFFRDARFTSPTRGSMAGEQRGGDVLFTTVDGGATWTIVEKEQDFARFTGLAFGDASHFWASGSFGPFASGGYIYASVDGGLTWTRQATTAQSLNGVWAVSATTAWVVGENGTVLRTTDGGVSWLHLAGGT